MHIDPISSLTPGKYLTLARQFRDESSDRHDVKLALLSSFSFSFLEPYLIVECARRNMRIQPWIAPFGQIEQPILDASEGLTNVNPDVIVIALRIEDVFADVFLRPCGDKLQDRARSCVERLENSVKSIRNSLDSIVLVANFAMPLAGSIGSPFDAGQLGTPFDVLGIANRELARRLKKIPGAYVWDYAGLVHSRGSSSWTDERLWRLARQPIAAANLPYAASHLARTIAGTVFEPVKCLVLDLDNTLWGGILGDDGVVGIQVGDDYPGNVFKAFQNAVLGLKDKGILLAVASKNDEPLVRRVFAENADMIIRWDDFATARISWQPKSESLISIADELNIGIDSLAFFDDNPVEREEVRQKLPQIHVIEPPRSPLGYVESLLGSGLFDIPAVSVEDADRTRYYRDENRRRELRATSTNMDDFLVSLEMKVTIESASEATIMRIAQLISKTNQFNLTTRRHSQSALQRMITDESYVIRWTRLADRYGDSGIIGVTIVHFDGKIAEIDSFVMSCRVMNRRVEDAMISDIIDSALARSCTSVRGQYIATERNSVVSSLYEASGFVKAGEGKEGGHFELDLSASEDRPEWPSCLSRN